MGRPTVAPFKNIAKMQLNPIIYKTKNMMS